jgi:hypothetical protein
MKNELVLDEKSHANEYEVVCIDMINFTIAKFKTRRDPVNHRWSCELRS